MLNLQGISAYYYIIIALQGYCVYHAYRRGIHQKWVWVIVFLPLVGSLVYIFNEVIKRNQVSNLQYGLNAFINPAGRIRRLESNFKFSDTIINRVVLANAYLEKGLNEEAIKLYEGGLTGLNQDNQEIILHLAEAYYNMGRYDDVIRIVPLISRIPHFSKTKANLFYALSLERTGKKELAEKEFKAMNHRFSNYESRYHYITFLLNSNRPEEAAALIKVILEEDGHMSRQEKREARVWIDKVKGISNVAVEATSRNA